MDVFRQEAVPRFWCDKLARGFYLCISKVLLATRDFVFDLHKAKFLYYNSIWNSSQRYIFVRS